MGDSRDGYHQNTLYRYIKISQNKILNITKSRRKKKELMDKAFEIQKKRNGVSAEASLLLQSRTSRNGTCSVRSRWTKC